MRCIVYWCIGVLVWMPFADGGLQYSWLLVNNPNIDVTRETHTGTCGDVVLLLTSSFTNASRKCDCQVRCAATLGRHAPGVQPGCFRPGFIVAPGPVGQRHHSQRMPALRELASELQVREISLARTGQVES